MDERGHCCLWSGKDLTQGKSDGGQAEQLRAGKGRKISFWREAMEDSLKKQRGWRREEKQGTYFPVYPNLRIAKRLNTGAGKQRDRERRK